MTRPAPTVTVPVEPTEAMLEILEDAAWFDEGGYLGQEAASETYRKLLAAAPAAPQAAWVGAAHPVVRNDGEAIRALRNLMAPFGGYIKKHAPALYIDMEAALRAQPQAREDAQPVAWLRSDTLDKLKSASVSMMGIQSLVAAHETKYNTVSVYTHPAPDALRVAVEALEAAGRAISAQYALAQAEYQHLDHLATKHDKTVQEGRRAIREALAALQAEQKGGA